MASGPKHYKEAESCLAQGRLEYAQVHATLALAAASAFVGIVNAIPAGPDSARSGRNALQWREATT